MSGSKRPQSFVGVCGIQSAEDLRKLEEWAHNILPQSGYFIMASVKHAQAISGFSDPLHNVRPFVHCDFSAEIPFETIVFRNLELTAGCVQGLQLNILPWMETDFAPLFSEVKRRYPQVALMLQAHRRIMDDYTPAQLCDRLRDLPIDYIFFDPSQSRGIGYEVSGMISYVDAVYRQYPNLGVAVAGGLGGQTMEVLFGPLATSYPGISCDAFGKLNDPSTGTLSWPAVDSYLQAWKRCILQ
jgi:hypothetical protein